jgi:hypothetical protein
MKTEDKIKFSLGWVLLMLFTCIAGTFGLTKYAGRENNSALREKNSALKTSLDAANLRAEKAEKAEKELGRIRREQPLSSPPEIAESLPNVTLDAAQNAETAKQLAEKLSHVENERDQYLQLLLQNTVNSLDPKSELHTLLEQLSSEDLGEQENALKGLFALKEPASFAPLANFFKKNVMDFTHSGYSLYDWYRLFVELDPNAGIELLVKDVGSQNRLHADAANHMLYLKIKSVELIDACKPHLKSLALRSPDSTARARAKVMLENFSKKRATLIEDEKKTTEEELAYRKTGKGGRTRTELLLNIERLVKELVSREPDKPEQSAPADATPSADQD